MVAPFPETGIIEVSSALADALLANAERLPLYDNEEFYDPALQARVHDQVREAELDGFDWLVDAIRVRVARWPYCVLVRGISFDEGNRLFVAINSAFGELVALPLQKPRAQLVHYIQSKTDIYSPRGGRESERLHTDATDWEKPIDLVSMVCVRADSQGGGRTRVLDVDTVRADVRKRLGAESVEILQAEPVPWQLHAYCPRELTWRTVLTVSGMCWRRHSINLALNSQRASLSAEMLNLLDEFEGVVEATDRNFEFQMSAGELLLCDNNRTIHARTPLSTAGASDRLMIRSWVRTS